jgi:hypothetical protein
MGVRFLSDDPSAIEALGPNDVVILPAFGVTVAMLRQLDRRGSTLIDTTCGSVLNVWKNVKRYAVDGFTSDGYSFLVEMLYAASRAGCRFAEVPITFVERRLGQSKLSTGVLVESAITPWRLVATKDARARGR